MTDLFLVDELLKTQRQVADLIAIASLLTGELVHLGKAVLLPHSCCDRFDTSMGLTPLEGLVVGTRL